LVILLLKSSPEYFTLSEAQKGQNKKTILNYPSIAQHGSTSLDAWSYNPSLDVYSQHNKNENKKQ